MNLQIRFREAWQSTAHKLLLEVEQWVTTINRAWRAQHADDGTHGVVTADQVIVGATEWGVPGDVAKVVAHSTTRADIFIGDQDATLGKRLRVGYEVTADYGVINAYDDAASAYKELRLDANPLVLNLDSGGAVGIGVSPSTRLDIDAGAIEFAEMTEPAAPSANGARLYVKDNGAGKTQLCVRFATGVVQVIATEP